MKKTSAGEPQQAIMAALGTEFCTKYVIVVDDDVDVFNLADVMWAVATGLVGVAACARNAKKAWLNCRCDLTTPSTEIAILMRRLPRHSRARRYAVGVRPVIR